MKSAVIEVKNLIIVGIITIIISNMCLYSLQLFAVLLPSKSIENKIRIGFQTGALTIRPHPFPDTTRGIDQYSDYANLQTAATRSGNLLLDMIAPRLLMTKGANDNHPPDDLYSFVFKTKEFDWSSGYYHRYWFGNRIVISSFLQFLSISQARRLLSALSYISIFIIMFCLLFQPKPIQFIMLPIGIFGFFFSALPHYGQSFNHAPSFIWVQLSALAMLLIGKRLNQLKRIVVLSLSLGTGSIFFDSANGAIILSAAYVFLLSYFFFATVHCIPPWRSIFRAFLSLSLFCFAIITSLLFKHIILSIIFGFDNTFGIFIGQLKWRVGFNEQITLIRISTELWKNWTILTYDSKSGAMALLCSTVGAWIFSWLIVAFYYLKKRNPVIFFDLGALIFSSSIVLSWYLLLRNHSLIHAWFTVRFLYIPMSLGFSTLIYVIYLYRRDIYRDEKRIIT